MPAISAAIRNTLSLFSKNRSRRPQKPKKAGHGKPHVKKASKSRRSREKERASTKPG